MKTKIREYFIFLLYWFFVIYLSLLIPLQQELENHLLYWKALEIGFIGFFGSLFFHSIQILENSISKYKIRLFRLIGFLYIIFLGIIVLFWDIMDQDRAKHIFWTENSHPTFEGPGAGLIINENIIYSSGHVVPREIFAFVACILFFIAYWKLNPVNVTDRIDKAHGLWKVASLSGVIFIISQSLWRISDFDPQIGTIFAIPIGIVAFIIIIYYPEAFIITQVQAVRILDLYDVSGDLHDNRDTHDLPEEVFQYLLEVANQLKNKD